MAYLQVKNVPDELHARLRAHAEQQGRTIRDIVLDAVVRELRRADFAARLAGRDPVKLDRPAAAYLAEARIDREC